MWQRFASLALLSFFEFPNRLSYEHRGFPSGSERYAKTKEKEDYRYLPVGRSHATLQDRETIIRRDKVRWAFKERVEELGYRVLGPQKHER